MCEVLVSVGVCERPCAMFVCVVRDLKHYGLSPRRLSPYQQASCDLVATATPV